MFVSLPRTINIRLATVSDSPGVENLVSTLMLNRSILEDLKQYNEARRDPVSTCYAAMTRLASFPPVMGPLGPMWV